jgi:DNA (cytosine-5)-methyltransferase 1
MSNPIKIIDLFSGPGGLGEGFSALKDRNGNPVFKIAISIEKELNAYRTLKLRAFFRQFKNNAPQEYYEFLKGNLGKDPEDQLYTLPKFSTQLNLAEREAQHLELGKKNTRKINQKIREAIDQEECLLIGGPPCQAYSLAGMARLKNNPTYNAEEDPRNFLYKEYLKVIAKFQPLVFVMENVKGLLSAKVKNQSIYNNLVKDLQDPCEAVNVKPDANREKHQYTLFSLTKPKKQPLSPKDFIVKSEHHGIPQNRHRVILLGIRSDLVSTWCPSYLEKTSKIPLLEVLSDLPPLRSGLSKEPNTDQHWESVFHRDISDTLQALRANNQHEIAQEIDRIKIDIKASGNGQGNQFSLQRTAQKCKNKELKKWLFDTQLGTYITHHKTRGHMASDLQRYLFCSVWGKISGQLNWEKRSPISKDYPEHLIPDHKNWKSGKFNNRFRVQPWNLPATTITCHISKDGHYYIHPDPLQCRSLTVREAARIQTFPDNYFFVGNQTEQYIQIGNAVPPLLANKIAKLIAKSLNIPTQ